MRTNPYQLVEGLLVAGFAVGATTAYIALKASFETEIRAVTEAVREMQIGGFCDDCTVIVVRGPEAYLYGEEKALLEVVEGNDPLPRLYPPYQHGLFATTAGPPNPTLVNNAETLCNVPHILSRGVDWFRRMGTEASPGHVIATVVGDVVYPDVGEVELGTPLGIVIDEVGGGVAAGREVKAVLSGVANAVVTDLDAPLSYEGMGMGAAGLVVFDDTACMVEVARAFSEFLAAESCGQCPACKTGSAEITARLSLIEDGHGDMGTVAEIRSWLDKVTDGNRCYLAVEEQQMVASIVRDFADEFVEHIERGRCPRPRPVTVPTLVDLRAGRATYKTP